MPKNPQEQPHTGDGANPVDAAAERESAPLSMALFRVMRATVFHDPPVPEMDALPLAQLRLLMTLHRLRDAPMKDFSEEMQVSQSTVTQLADKLARRGLAERHADPDDRRVARLRLSESARAMMEATDRERRETLTAICRALPAGRQSEIVAALTTLAETAEAVRAAQGRPVPPMRPPRISEDGEQTPAEAPRPALDLMSRRVRGTSGK